MAVHVTAERRTHHVAKCLPGQDNIVTDALNLVTLLRMALVSLATEMLRVQFEIAIIILAEIFP